MTWLLVMTLVILLAGGAGTAYYRSKFRRAESALDLIKSVNDEWRAQHEALSEQLESARKALQLRLDKEAALDEATKRTATTSASMASELLNSLHPNLAGPGTAAQVAVQPGTTPDVPDDPRGDLRAKRLSESSGHRRDLGLGT